MTAFENLSRDAARAFLQTIVVVDDAATFSLETEIPELSGGQYGLTIPNEFASAGEEKAPKVALPTPASGLDATVVGQAFAKVGLVCSILRPTAAADIEEEILSAAARADILVLDWQLADQGALATRVVQRLIEGDEVSGGRLRLIAIYTENSPLAPIRTSLAGGFPRLQEIQNEMALGLASAKVIFLTKGSPSANPGEGDLSVESKDLPNRLVNEFAKFAGGLLPNATLAAIGGLRQHTHRVLSRFDKSLDGPLLTHRTLLSSPQDADQYAADLILAELGAQVPIERIVSKYLGEKAIKDYVGHKMDREGIAPKLMLNKTAGQVYPLKRTKTRALIKNGLLGISSDYLAIATSLGQANEVTKVRDRLLKDLHELLYLLVEDDLAESQAHHSRFAVRSKLKRDATSVRADDAGTLPKLRLGALLRRDETYWICLTPFCDSQRIPKNGGRFLLALLSPSHPYFELVVPDGNTFQRLSVERKRPHLETHIFRPNSEGDIRAIIRGGVATFQTDNPLPPGTKQAKYVWLGELKSMQAVKFIQAFSTNLSRVALDDFEWHRLQEARGQ